MINDYPILTIGWNIYLLLIPFGLCHLIIALKRSKLSWLWKRVLTGLSAFFWLIFMPNTAYIMTDIRHLNEFCPGSVNNVCLDNAWQIMIFFAYGAIGWVAFVYLLDQMARVVKASFGATAARLFIFLIIPMIALGVLLGLLDRWNSWELFIYPRQIAASLLSYALVPARFYAWLVYALFLYLLYGGGHRLFFPPPGLTRPERKKS